MVRTDGTDAHVLVEDVSLLGPIAWSPDGRFLAFRSGPDRGISTYDFTSGRVELRDGSASVYGDPMWSAAGDLVYLHYVRTGELITHDLIRDVTRAVEWRGDGGWLAAANPCGPSP